VDSNSLGTRGGVRAELSPTVLVVDSNSLGTRGGGRAELSPTVPVVDSNSLGTRDGGRAELSPTVLEVLRLGGRLLSAASCILCVKGSAGLEHTQWPGPNKSASKASKRACNQPEDCLVPPSQSIPARVSIAVN
jgi:hypothetical protein